MRRVFKLSTSNELIKHDKTTIRFELALFTKKKKRKKENNYTLFTVLYDYDVGFLELSESEFLLAIRPVTFIHQE